MPYVLGVAVIGILWRFLLSPNVGLVNYYLGALGLPDDIPWITALPWAWVSLVGVTVWWTLGFNTVIYLAGLQDIASFVAERDGDLPRVLVDPQVQHRWFSYRLSGGRSDTSPYQPEGEPLLLSRAALS